MGRGLIVVILITLSSRALPYSWCGDTFREADDGGRYSRVQLPSRIANQKPDYGSQKLMKELNTISPLFVDIVRMMLNDQHALKNGTADARVREGLRDPRVQAVVRKYLGEDFPMDQMSAKFFIELKNALDFNTRMAEDFERIHQWRIKNRSEPVIRMGEVARPAPQGPEDLFPKLRPVTDGDREAVATLKADPNIPGPMKESLDFYLKAAEQNGGVMPEVGFHWYGEFLRDLSKARAN